MQIHQEECRGCMEKCSVYCPTKAIFKDDDVAKMEGDKEMDANAKELRIAAKKTRRGCQR